MSGELSNSIHAELTKALATKGSLNREFEVRRVMDRIEMDQTSGRPSLFVGFEQDFKLLEIHEFYRDTLGFSARVPLRIFRMLQPLVLELIQKFLESESLCISDNQGVAQLKARISLIHKSAAI